MRKFLKNNWFLFTMIIGILLGCLTGYLSPATSLGLSDTDANDLGIEITIKRDGSYSITQNVASEKAGTEVKSFQSGEWEKTSDTEILLHPEEGDDVTVTLVDGKWSCEIPDPENQGKEICAEGAQILGIDYAMQGMAVFSEEIEHEKAGFFRKNEKRIRRAGPFFK